MAYFNTWLSPNESEASESATPMLEMWGWRLEGRRGPATHKRVHMWTRAELDSQPGLSPVRPLEPCSWQAHLPTLALLRWDSALHVLVFAIRKFSGPSSAEISPSENQITSFAEKGLIARGTRQREFCCLFSLKKITVLSPVSSLHRSRLEIGL